MMIIDKSCSMRRRDRLFSSIFRQPMKDKVDSSGWLEFFMSIFSKTLLVFIFFMFAIPALLLGEPKWPAKKKLFKLLIESQYSPHIPLINPHELSRHIKDQAFVILDTRKKQEFEVSHLSNALWVGYGEFSLDKVRTISKEQPIVVYCSLGIRSDRIAEKLRRSGYQKVYNLYGGIFYWINEGKQVYRGPSETEEIHPFNSLWGKWLAKGNKVYDP